LITKKNGYDTHKDMVEHAADLIMTKVPANIKAGNKLQEPVFVRVGTFFLTGSHTSKERE